jgi:hypothetical protein
MIIYARFSFLLNLFRNKSCFILFYFTEGEFFSIIYSYLFIEQKLLVFKNEKLKSFSQKFFVLFLCFIFSWEQTLRFRFENIFVLKNFHSKINKNKNLIGSNGIM